MADEPTQKPPQPDPSQGKPEEKSVPAEKPAAASASGEAKPPEAAKPAAPPAAAKPPAPPAKKEEVKPEPLDNDLLRRFRKRFGEAIREATLDRKQAIVLVAAERLAEVAEYAREEEQFDMLADLTATDWPKREKRFEVVLNLYSFPRNERLRLKAQVAEGEPCPSVTSVWGAANWLERECFDMFGIQFAGHPDLRRILLPDEWQGHPLRKDYDILTQDAAWVRENLGIESGQ